MNFYKTLGLKNSRIDVADDLRGLAVAGIILYHSVEHGNMYDGHQHGSFLENAYGNLRYGQVATYYWCMMKGRHTQTICLFILGMLV